MADEVAKALVANLDVVIARKLRAPYQPELGIGAVVDGDQTVLDEEVLRSVWVSQDYLNREIAYQRGEVERRLRFYRGDRPAPEVAGRTVIIIDDGTETGFTFRAFLESLRQRHPSWLVAAAPVAARDRVEMLKAFADDIVCLHMPVSSLAAGAWYGKFEQLSDEEAVGILRRSWSTLPLAA